MSSASPGRTTLRSLRADVARGGRFAMLTCYDAISARWLFDGGVRCFLVGDTAAQMILGHDSTLPAPLDFMIPLTAAVRRGAPHAFVLADMPFGSYQASADDAVRNAARFLAEGGADAVKLEVDASYAPLVERLARAGIPPVPHLGARPQHVRATGGHGKAGQAPAEAERIEADAQRMLEAGAAMLLLEAVPDDLTARVTARATASGDTPVVGCGAGPSAHGSVVVLHDLLGLSEWQPPFASPAVQLGPQMREAAETWRRRVEEAQET
jgi:3-methyl-2-oxobutanoate hydroxymethyltransferase